MNKTLQDIHERRSIRAFKPEQISERELSVIVEAGKIAPSAMNRQPWHFTVIQNKDLLEWMVERNKQIVLDSPEFTAQSKWINTPNYHNYYQAPTLILISGEKSNPWHVFDCGLAMENMALAAQAISLGTCIVASTRFLFQTEQADEYIDELGIPKGYVPVCALAVGYIDGKNPEPTPRKADCVNYIR